MKKTKLFILFFATLLLGCVGLTSCDKLTTINVDGPDIEVVLNYDATRSATSGSYTLVANSDTVYAEDINDFLDANQSVNNVELRNTKITLPEGTTFAGVDSIQIRYQKVGETKEIVLVTGGVSASSGSTMDFTDINDTQGIILDLITHDVVFKMYSIYDPTVANFNCFTIGTAYTLTAGTVIKVNLLDLL